MNTLLIWILLPMTIGLVLSWLPRWRIGVAAAGTLTALLLAAAALRLPMEGIINIGPWNILIEDQAAVAGIQFTLPESGRSLLITLYGTLAFVLGGAVPAKVHKNFIPFSLIAVALIIAAFSAKPIMYGIFFYQFVVLICVFILTPPGHDVSKGILRFLSFQVIGHTFILLAVLLLMDREAILIDLPAMMRASLILGFGFVFLFAIFPLYTWVIMIAEDRHPYTAMFVFSMIFGGYTLFFLGFLNEYNWLFGVVDVFPIIRFVGVLMVATGGAWAAFQRDLGRLFGYAVVVDLGYSLCSIGLQNGDLHYAMVIPRLITLAVWALALSVLREQTGDLGFRVVKGMVNQNPIAVAGILLSHFSFTGLPLLAGFPILLTLLKQLVMVESPQAVWCFLGSIGLAAGGLRSMAALVMGYDPNKPGPFESVPQKIYLVIGIVTIFVFGFFPHWLYPWFTDLVSAFPFYNP